MARIVDYEQVTAAAESLGLLCLYHRSGAFGFGGDAAVEHVGWIGAADPTVREDSRKWVRQAGQPYAEWLARGVGRAMAALGAERIWLMPMSHWAYELGFGNADCLGELLARAGVDAAELRGRTDGSAIELGPAEVVGAVRLLLEKASGTDFSLLMPGVRLIGIVHHHGQIWWSGDDAQAVALLREISLE